MPSEQPVSDPRANAGPEAFAAALDDFMRAARRARGRLAEDDGELTLSQFLLLEPLVEAGAPLASGALAAAAGVTAPTATRMLDGLERRGLVERSRDPGDRRLVRVAITPAGADEVRRRRALMDERRRRIFDELAPSERRAAARLLTRLAAVIEDLR